MIILKFFCLSIHDCFCLRLGDINPCIDYINLFFFEGINFYTIGSQTNDHLKTDDEDTVFFNKTQNPLFYGKNNISITIIL